MENIKYIKHGINFLSILSFRRLIATQFFDILS
jgi:hypothetical protein